MGQSDKSRSAVAEEAAARPRPASQMLARAVALHLGGKSSEALAELEKALLVRERLTSAELAEVYSALGYLRFECRQFDKAAEAYAGAVEQNPLYPSGCYNLGLCLEALESWRPAAEQFEKALSQEPGHREAQLGLGACLLQAGEAARALEVYERCLESHPDLETARFGKGVALHLQKKFAEAAGIYRQVLEKNPGFEECLTNAIQVSAELKEFAAVPAYAERLLQLRPGDVAALEGWPTRYLRQATTRRRRSGAGRW